MAVQGKIQTYGLTVGVKLDFEDLIHMISPTDVPLQTGTGAEGGSTLSSGPCFEKKVEWQDEELLLPKSTAAASATTTQAFITVASGHQIRFSTGDEIIDKNTSERMRVTGYGSTTDTLTVTRGVDSTTSTAVATSDTLLIIGNILAEGADPENARAVDRTARYNMTQIFGPTAVHVTGSENAIQKYGLTVNEFDKQVANRTIEQMIQLEQALLYGVRIEDAGNFWRAMNGIFSHITTNVYSTATTITETLFLDQIQACFDAGGNPDRALMGSLQKRRVSDFHTNLTIQSMRPDNGRGQAVHYFESDFGVQTMILDRWVHKTDIAVFSRDQAEVCTLRPFQFEMLAKTGDSEKGQVVGEKSMRFRVESHAAKFTALT